jgi:hypothetical protein
VSTRAPCEREARRTRQCRMHPERLRVHVCIANFARNNSNRCV